MKKNGIVFAAAAVLLSLSMAACAVPDSAPSGQPIASTNQTHLLSLDLTDYSGWAYADETITFAQASPVFVLAYDEAAKELHLTRNGEVEIIPQTVNGMVTKGGPVLIDITMAFKAK